MTSKRKQRIAIDTGVHVSAMMTADSTTGRASALAFASAVVLASEESLQELQQVLWRRKFARYATEDFRQGFLRQVRFRSKLVEVTTTIHECRDPKDNFLLSLAIDGRADLILTGDKDLLEMNPFRAIEIIDPAEFLRRG